MKKVLQPLVTKKKQVVQYYGYLLFFIPFLLYLQTLSFDFVYHDDDVIIIEGAPILKAFDLKKIFFTDAWLKEKQIELYRPWQSFTYAIDYAVGNGKPWAFHLHNVLVFCACIQLLFLFLQRLNIPLKHSFFLSLLFSVHFLFVHTVSWIPARGDLYLCLFSLATFLVFFSFLDNRKFIYSVSVALLFFLALLSKESGIMLFPLLIVLAYCVEFKKIEFKIILPFLLMLVCMAIYFVMREKSILAQEHFFSVNGLLFNLRTFPEEVCKFFIPAFFSVMPAYSLKITTGGLVLILILAFFTIYSYKSMNIKLLLTAMALFALPLLPSVFYKPEFSVFAYDYLDHRMLFPGIGLLLLSYLLVDTYFNRFNWINILLVPIVINAFISFYYSGNYKNLHSYYANATTTNPKSALAWLNHGVMLSREHKYKQASEKFSKAVELYPDSMYYRNVLAEAYKLNNEPEKMLHECRLMIKINPSYPKSYLHIAEYFARNNQTDSAINYLSKAIKVDSLNSEIYFHRSKLYTLKKMDSVAIADISESIRLNPQNSEAYLERGNIFGRLGNPKKALDDLNEFITLSPNEGLGYFYRGQALFYLGRKEEACADLDKAVKMGVSEAKDKFQAFCH